MEYEPSGYKEMPTEALVDAYISLPKEGRSDWGNLSKQEKESSHRVTALYEDAIKRTKEGAIDVSVAEAGMIDAFDKLIKRYPHLADREKVNRLYSQAKAWTAYSICLKESGISIPGEIQEAQERAGRLYLLAGIAAQTKVAALTAYACTSLLNTRKKAAAVRLAQACSLHIIIAESPEEADELPRKFGETNEANIKSRIAEVKVVKPRNPNLN